MSRDLIDLPLRALLSGLMLAACGGAPETELAPSAELLGTQASAICSGSSVSTLTILGASSYGGEVAGSGSWSVSYPANAVHLDFYVDGVLSGSSELQGDANRSGNWNFSYRPVGCGSHTLEVRAYPMTISSSGTDRCPTSGTQTRSSTFTQACPSASVACGRSGSYIVCNGSGSGGTGGPYSSFWQFDAQSTQGETYTSSWYNGAGTQSYYCPSTRVFYPSEQLTVSFKVLDNSGMDSPVASSNTFHCAAGTYFYYDPGSGW